MTAPSTRPTRKKVGRARSAAGSDAAAASRRPRVEGDDRPRAPIRTRGLTKMYGDLVAVDHLDLEVQAGEIFGLLGQNGAGKTTTILMLLGLTEPTEGQARVVGLDPARRPLEVKRRVGYLPDAVGFYGDMTGRDNLRYTARLNRIPRDEAEDAIDEALEQVGLTNRADDHTEQYSRGMLQRLGIADALIKDPDVLILDEPTTAIDPLGVTEILDLLRSLVTERQMAILLSSHLLNQVQHVCDRIGIFAAGRLIGQGTMSDLSHRFGEDTATVEAEFQTDDAAGDKRVREVLTAIPGVTGVTAPRRGNEAWSLSVKPASDETRVRRAVLAAASSTGLDLTSVRSVAPSLEEIYRKAVERAAHGHARDVR
ncbi:MAG: type transport system ATP-binding protein [Chloroflexota bacterium]|jgi:ABC-2 type transport system ATP-binding protein|nr:type transport system ATP-binding protein [Chloroflexota bacterium]